MSFLGYTPKEYSYLLPPSIKIAVEQNVSNPVIKETATSTKKVSVSTQPASELKIEAKKISITSNAVKTKSDSEKIISPIQTSSTTNINIPTISSTTSNSQSIIIDQNKTQQTSSHQLYEIASVNEKISASVVNIYCQAIRGSKIETITGSAVMIDPSGVYLTNAHVAIYVMLSDTQPAGTISCYIREGSPAKKIYEAKSIYIPSAWVYSHTNAYQIGIDLTGTGEKDYALIKRGSPNPNLSSSDFPLEWSARIVSNLPINGQNIILSGYPVFDKSIITSALYLLTNNSKILNSFDLSGEHNALFDSDSTKLAQIGSSGGGAFDEQGNLFGIMDAAINNIPGELPSERIVGINYIKNDILKDTGKTFENIIMNANTESKNFILNYAPSLSQTLISNQ